MKPVIPGTSPGAKTRRPPPPPDSEKAKKYDYSPMDRGPAPAPNPDGSQPYIDTDPLKELLSQGDIRFHGEPAESIPEELGEFLATHDMGKRYFQVVLKRLDEGADEGSTNAAFVKSWYRGIPSLEWVINNYGPGNYVFVVNWRQSDPETGKPGAQSEKIPFMISDRCQAQYEEYQRQRRITTRKAEADKVRQLKLDRTVDDAIEGVDAKPAADPRESARAYLTEITGMAKELGLSRADGSGLGWIKDFLPLLVPVISGLIENGNKQAAMMQAQFNSILTLMLSQGEKNNQQLLELAKINQGQGSGASAVKEFKDMVLGAVDLKEALNGNKESLVDRIFGVVEAVLPQIITVSAKSKTQQAFDPRVALARSFVKTSPDFQAAMADPAVMAQVVGRLDDHYGWRQTDSILTVAGIERPSSCPRDPGIEQPADQRARAADATVVDQDQPPEGTEG